MEKLYTLNDIATITKKNYKTIANTVLNYEDKKELELTPYKKGREKAFNQQDTIKIINKMTKVDINTLKNFSDLNIMDIFNPNDFKNHQNKTKKELIDDLENQHDILLDLELEIKRLKENNNILKEHNKGLDEWRKQLIKDKEKDKKIIETLQKIINK